MTPTDPTHRFPCSNAPGCATEAEHDARNAANVSAPPHVGPRGVPGEVTVVDLSGHGVGPWRLFVGAVGVADWPCKPASEDPEGYAHEVARCVRVALREHENQWLADGFDAGKRRASASPAAAPTVTVRDLGGCGHGPWRVLVGGCGIADFPVGKLAEEDPEAYADEVARCIRDALADAAQRTSPGAPTEDVDGEDWAACAGAGSREFRPCPGSDQNCPTCGGPRAR